MASFATDYQAVYDLEKELLTNYKAILVCNEALKEDMNAANEALQDDGFDVMSAALTASQKKLYVTADELFYLCKQLHTYADRLKEAKQATS